MILRFLGAQWLAIGVIGAVSFGISVLLARALGPDQFGVYATALSAGALVGIVIDGGFGKLLLRERVRATGSLAALGPFLPGLAYGHALLVLLLLSALVLLGFAPHRLTMLAALWFFGAAALNQFGLAILRGDGRLVRDASWQIGNRGLTAACIVLALFLGAGAPWQVLTAQGLGAAGFGLLIMRYLRIRPGFGLTPQVYRAVLPFAWLDFATVLYFRADMMLFPVLGVSGPQAGNYGVAYRLIEAVVLFASPIGLILFRRFRQTSATPQRMLDELRPALALATVVGLGLMATLWLFSERIIAAAYGGAYQGAGALLAALGCSLIFILPNGILNQAALALGMERWFAASASLAACANIAGNLWLVPTHGAIAAAWMTVLTEAILGGCIAAGVLARCRRIRIEKGGC